ncbi:hypothetical protein CDG81_13480 [Actinopolyspora erythraea]|uniref:Uncharacterized protein n=1 Tax=Actinopolyspora erythraea TaxID=414996 RepID=A0A099D355_9ACTN|nr:hypothetical protein [Actinopolyspora erythraea]ASU79131.1 hypothetical protein CDG81_13480 [Actinopolyspora erythraea]KGI80593.1 hypothetical protein IL38_16315 [Actinopolyspora erythraea]
MSVSGYFYVATAEFLAAVDFIRCIDRHTFRDLIRDTVFQVVREELTADRSELRTTIENALAKLNVTEVKACPVSAFGLAASEGSLSGEGEVVKGGDAGHGVMLAFTDIQPHNGADLVWLGLEAPVRGRYYRLARRHR